MEESKILKKSKNALAVFAQKIFFAYRREDEGINKWIETIISVEAIHVY